MENINEVVNIITNFIGNLGYLGIYIVITLEYSALPIPSEVVLPLLGFSAYHGKFSLIGVLICSTLGALTGSLVCYFAGYYGGKSIINFIERKSARYNKIFNGLQYWFSNHAKITVLLARIIPMTRTPVSILAGTENLSLTIYLIYTSLGILIWNGILILLGYFIGDNLSVIIPLMRKYSILCFSLLALILIIFICIKLKNKKS